MHHLHGELKLQRTILAKVLEGILPDFEKQPPGIQLVKFSDALEINVDSEQIKTVFKNIFANAIKFSKAESDPVQIMVRQEPHYTVVLIIDNGIGIQPEEISFIFEPFYRVDKSRAKDTGGYGLGLSLCKTIMDAHNGKIEVASEPGEGTTVSLFFPR
jgi:signal transduction histidine kinase